MDPNASGIPPEEESMAFAAMPASRAPVRPTASFPAPLYPMSAATAQRDGGAATGSVPHDGRRMSETTDATHLARTPASTVVMLADAPVDSYVSADVTPSGPPPRSSSPSSVLARVQTILGWSSTGAPAPQPTLPSLRSPTTTTTAPTTASLPVEGAAVAPSLPMYVREAEASADHSPNQSNTQR